MAYDNDFRSGPRDRDGRDRDRDDLRWRNERSMNDRGGRGFFERAGDELASWFGDEDAERRRDQDERSDRYEGSGRERSVNERGGAQGGWFGGRSDEDRDRQGRGGWFGGPTYGRQDSHRQQGSREEYRPLGDYGRSASNNRDWQGHDEQRNFGGSGARDRLRDPHYSEWRQRQIDALDNDYDDYRREHQSKFENDFSGWRTQRQSKREILSSLRDGMDVVGSDEQRIGTVDKVKGDRVVLRKNDPEAGGVHRSFIYSLIDRVDGERLLLSKTADDARGELQREDRGEAYNPQRERGRSEPLRSDNRDDNGPHMLERSFSGTYR